MNDTPVPVLIVGAGPVGLTTALRLASFGVRSVVLEAEPALRKQGSKACLIQGDVLEVLDKVGCAEQVAGEGVTWTVGHLYVGGKEIDRQVYERPIGFGPFVNISQYRIEQILLERLQNEPLAELHWNHRVTAVSQDDAGVTVTAETPDGPRTFSASYLVASDGVRSALRQLVGVEWSGYSHGDRFLITDIRAELPVVKERHFHYDPPFNPGRQLVMHPQPDNVWRIDWQLPADADIDEERRTGALDRRIRAVIGDVPYEIDWLSTYRFHQRVVVSFRVGRALFAGDAAHALPPYGARGMNSGIQDADNLAWKLAMVVTGQAGEALLDSYHTERYAAAKENLRVTEETIQFMVPPNRYRRLFRNVVLKLSLPFKAIRRHVNAGKMAEPYVYRESPIIEPDTSPLIGVLLPDAPVSVDGVATRLRRLTGHGFVGLYVAEGYADAARFVEAAQARPTPVPVSLAVVLPDGVDAGDLAERATVARADDLDALARYTAQPRRWLIVRPDGHVGAARTTDRLDEFAATVARCAGCPPVDAGRTGGEPALAV